MNTLNELPELCPQNNHEVELVIAVSTFIHLTTFYHNHKGMLLYCDFDHDFHNNRFSGVTPSK